MKTQTFLGWLFLVLGLVLFAIDIAPTVMAIHERVPAPLPSFILLGIAIGVAVFGGWLLPSAHVGAVVREYLAAARTTRVPVIGSGDAPSEPPPPPPGS